MAFSSSTVTIGYSTKKSDYDRLLDNTIYLKTELAKASKGKADITISEYATTAAPDVKAKSVFENNGTLTEVSTDVTPTGYSGISVSTNFYLYYDESTAAFIYSETAPTWSDALQGWYNSNDRAFFSMYKDSGGTLYQLKTKLQDQNNIKIGNIETLDSSASWTVPINVYRVKATIIGAGGGGGASNSGDGGTGGTTTFNSISSTGGTGGKDGDSNHIGSAGTSGFASGNGGQPGIYANDLTGSSGNGGQIKVQIFSVTPSSSIAYTIGAGGSAGSGYAGKAGGAGGAGQIILEY